MYENKVGARVRCCSTGDIAGALNNAQLVKALDDVQLTANGLVVDTHGHAVSIVPELKNAVGEAGAITKKGAAR